MISPAELAEWLNHPITRALRLHFHRRKQEVVQNFLAGTPQEPARQGRAAGWDDIEKLLKKKPEEIAEQFNTEGN